MSQLELEIKAMQKIAKTLSDFDKSSRNRILSYVTDTLDEVANAGASGSAPAEEASDLPGAPVETPAPAAVGGAVSTANGSAGEAPVAAQQNQPHDFG